MPQSSAWCDAGHGLKSQKGDLLRQSVFLVPLSPYRQIPRAYAASASSLTLSNSIITTHPTIQHYVL